jgi:hypothetical protein
MSAYDYRTPVAGNGPPGPSVVIAGLPYLDQNGSRLWRATVTPNVYAQVSGEGVGNDVLATLSGGVVTITVGGQTVETVTT